ncbi:MAG: maleylpyruvate isomerase family mycothiol-dependent enzyme [Acidimicrobiales bacterium]|nr:maleylpyruvate isomerase family mycothiol-dependent enzyme [Acidimicrobiales bacterium]
MRDVLDQLDRATADVVTALGDADLDAPSLLPGWSRLTTTCHLRYGAEALRRMTEDALAGRPTSYYPGGRSRQRPITLTPREGESASAVVASLRDESKSLHEGWHTVNEWATPVVEPPDDIDLGPIELRRLALARLTEVEVHGTDLDVGLGPWSEVFVRHVLPMRLEWLNDRRTNGRHVDASIHASWLLLATDMPVSQVVTVDGPTVVSQSGDSADATITGTGSELLALLLGRAPAGFAPEDFNRALPGP